MISLTQEAALSVLEAFLTVLGAAVIGQRLGVYWATRQKRKELALGSAHEFYRLYGEFFAVWKLWDYAFKTPHSIEDARGNRWAMLHRATAAEAGLEALLVKLSVERELGENERETAGRFRQGFQSLRQAIRDNRPLGWVTSEQPEYLEFKRLACAVASLIASSEKGKAPSSPEAQASLIAITANRWEGTWSTRMLP